MDYYFLVITAVDVFVLGIMCALTNFNEILTSKQKQWLNISFVLIIVISVLEVVSVAVDDTPSEFRWINIVVNYLGFGLTPVIPIFLSFSLRENKINKPIIIAESVYLLLLAISVPFGWIFYIDAANHYMRGDLFELYIVVYSMSTIYLLVSTVRIAGKYQNRGRNCIYLIVTFLLICTMVQVAFPRLHISWMCVSLLAIVYSVYCNIMWQQLDGLTGMLNQNSYLNKIASLNKDMILIVFDIDDFKKINDTYGHSVGDECLKEASDCIKKAYSKDGLCYRIGGDEFCVLLSVNADKRSCDEVFISELGCREKSLNKVLNISFGSALFMSGDDVDKVKELADSNMYHMKKEHKKQNANETQILN